MIGKDEEGYCVSFESFAFRKLEYIACQELKPAEIVEITPECMSTAMGMFLQQVVLQRGIPFEIKIPQATPVAYGALTDEAFDKLMEQAVRSASEGKCIPFEAFDAELRQELGI